MAEMDGVRRKGRFDCLAYGTEFGDGLKPTIYDWKTADDASYFGFRRAARKWGYIYQAAQYTEIYFELCGVMPRFKWIVVESKRPHATAVYEADPVDIAEARLKLIDAIARCQKAEETGQWPGYPRDGEYLTLGYVG